MHETPTTERNCTDRSNRPVPTSVRRASTLLIVVAAFVALLAVIPGAAAAEAPTCTDVTYEQDGDTYLVETAGQLQCIGSSDTEAGLEDDYRLTADIDLSDPDNADPVGEWNDGDGFTPIGTQDDPFTGTFDGNGHTISGLVTKRALDDGIGLFGHLGKSAHVSALTLIGASIEGDERVAVLAGGSAGTTVEVTVRDSEVIAASPSGGLIGSLQETGVVEHATVDGTTVSGTTLTGGLVGAAWVNTEIHRSTVMSSEVEVLEDTVGGFVGLASAATITESSVVGTTVGPRESFNNGGFIGQMVSGELRIARSYVKGSTIHGERHVGGFVGRGSAGLVTDSYVVGSEIHAKMAGGFVGGNYRNGQTVRVYTANTLVNTTGDGFGAVNACCFGVSDAYTSSDNRVINQGDEVDSLDEKNVTVLSPDQMQGAAASDNMAAFNFSSPCGKWVTASGEYPKLRWEVEPDHDCDYGLRDGPGTPSEDTETEEPETTTAGDGMTTTDAATTTAGDETSPATATAGDAPGFGVAVAVVGLLAAALLAVRRRD